MVEGVIRADGERRTRLLAMTKARQTPIGVDDGLGQIPYSFGPLPPRLPDHLLPPDQRKSQPDPGESVLPEWRDRLCAGGAARRLSPHPSPATGCAERD